MSFPGFYPVTCTKVYVKNASFSKPHTVSQRSAKPHTNPFRLFGPTGTMASGPPPSPIVHLLPIVENLTLLDENGCRALLQGVSKRFPEIGLDIVHAHTPAGVNRAAG